MYLLTVQGALGAGYLFGINRRRSGSFNAQGGTKALHFTKTCIVATFAAAIIGMVNYSAEVRAGTSLAQALVNAGSDLGNAYRQKGANIRQVGEGISQRYATLATSMAVMALPLSIAYWQRLGGAWRITFILSRIAELCSWIISGTSKGVADTLVIGTFFAFCLYWRQRWTVRKVFAAAGGSILALTTLLFFAESKVSGPSDALLQDISLPIAADLTNPLVVSLDRNEAIVACLAFNYLSQGYYGLARSFEFPFVWCWFCGHGPLATQLVRELQILDVTDQTLPARMEAIGWDKEVRWHTLYVWIASDLSHLGVPVFMFGIGLLFGSSWKSTLLRRNPFGIILSYLIIQMLFYVPANNQVLGFEATALAFWFCLAGFIARGICSTGYR